MAKRYVCVGQRESGKSYWAAQLIKQRLAEGDRRALVWVAQPEAKYDGVELTKISDAAEHPDAPIWVFRPPVTLAEVVCLARELRRRRPSEDLCLVIDELADPQVTTGGASPDWKCEVLREILQTVRGVSLVGTTQTPQNMPQPLRQLADQYFMFCCTGEGALRRLENDGVPEEKVRALRTLPPRVCIASKPGKW